MSAIFAVFLAFCPARQSAQARYSQNGEADFSFEVKNGKAVITGYSGKSPDMVIPRRLCRVPVTEIGYKAFSYCAEYDASSENRPGRRKLRSAVIPDGVTRIRAGAFKDNRLKRLELPASLILYRRKRIFGE